MNFYSRINSFQRQAGYEKERKGRMIGMNIRFDSPLHIRSLFPGIFLPGQSDDTFICLFKLYKFL